MAKQITITVPRDYTKGVKIEVDGVAGPSCEKLTEKIEAALGTVINREHKDEYLQTEAQGQQNLETQ